MIEAYPPALIIICTRMGDWIEWKPNDPERWPETGDCPFGECDCVPIVYGRLTPPEH